MSGLFKKKHVVRLVTLLLFVFVVGGIGGVFFEQYAIPRIRSNAKFSRLPFFKKASESVTIINKTEQITVNENDSVNKIAQNAANSVVNILSANREETKINKVASSVAQKESVSGTGVIVTSDGLVVTYRSAILENNADYIILLSSGSYYEAKLIGIDEFTNLAYLKVDASNLPVIAFANSDSYYPGKKMVVIGNSFGEYQNRFSAGLLSNVDKIFNLDGKTVSSTEKLEGVFETDFNNQKEYIGGPMISYNGELVGIVGSLNVDNIQKYFQIPANAVRASMDLVINGKLGERPFLGAYYIPITKEYSLVNELNRDRGAMIYSVSGKQGLAIIADSPAEKAGLKLNDIIIAVNGQEINLSNPLSNELSNFSKGDAVNLLVIREGKEITISVTI